MKRLRVFFIIASALVWLPGCTSAKFADVFKPAGGATEANASADPEPTGTTPEAATAEGQTATTGLLGADPKDDLSLGQAAFPAGKLWPR